MTELVLPPDEAAAAPASTADTSNGVVSHLSSGISAGKLSQQTLSSSRVVLRFFSH